MRTIYIILVVMILLPLASSAAVKNTRNDIRKFKTELNLTQQQMSQLDAIYSSFQAQVKLQAPQATQEQKKQLRIERRKQLHAEIGKVLTADQKTQLRAMMQANKAKKKK